MGVEDFYGKWIRGAIQRRPEIKPRYVPTGNRSYSLLIDMNGMIHMVRNQVFGKESEERMKELYRKFEIMTVEEMSDDFEEDFLVGNELETKEDLEKFMKYITKKINEQETDEDFLVEKFSEILQKDFEVEFLKVLTNFVEMYHPEKLLYLAIDGVAPLPKIEQQRKRRFKAVKLAKTGTVFERVLNRITSSIVVTPGTDWMNKLTELIFEWIEDRSKNFSFPEKIVFSDFEIPGEGEHKIFEYIQHGNIIVEGKMEHIVVGKDADLVMLSLVSPLNNIIVNRERPGDNISISALKKTLDSDMNFEPGENLSVLYTDFLLITLSIGNDFLPRIYVFKNVQESLDFFINIYKILGLRLTTPDTQIIWENFVEFLKVIDESLEIMVDRILETEWEYPPTMLLESMIDSKFDYDVFRELWYNNALLPNNDIGFDILRSVIGELPTVEDSDIDIMCKKYLEGLQWILRYYTSDLSKRDYSYGYNHAPLINDLIVTIENNFTDLSSVQSVSAKWAGARTIVRTDKSFEIPHQLAVVIPSEVAGFYLEPELLEQITHLEDLMPSGFQEEYDMILKGKEHQALAILPPMDKDAVERVLKTIKLKKLSSGMQRMMLSKNTIERISTVPASRGRGGFRGRGNGERGGFRGRGNGEFRGRGRGNGEFRGRGKGNGEFRGRERGNGGFRGRGNGGFRGRGNGEGSGQ